MSERKTFCSTLMKKSSDLWLEALKAHRNSESILNGKVVTDDVYPLICDAFESTIDIDTIEDFILESIVEFNNEK